MIQKLKSVVRVSVIGAGLLLSSAAQASAETCADLFLNEAIRVSPEFVVSEFSRPADRTYTGHDGTVHDGFITDRIPMTAFTIHEAYKRGIFSWGENDAGYGIWHRPSKRGVLFFDEISIPDSDMKDIRKLLKKIESGELRMTFDTAYEQVVRSCKEMPRFKWNPVTREKELTTTWISDELIKGYADSFRMGIGHSAELWRGDTLIAGSYGTLVNGIFAGESMFHLHSEKNTGKLLFYMLLEKLKSMGFTMADTQVAYPGSGSLTVKWGARLIPDAEFTKLREEAARRGLRWK